MVSKGREETACGEQASTRRSWPQRHVLAVWDAQFSLPPGVKHWYTHSFDGVFQNHYWEVQCGHMRTSSSSITKETEMENLRYPSKLPGSELLGVGPRTKHFYKVPKWPACSSKAEKRCHGGNTTHFGGKQCFWVWTLALLPIVWSLSSYLTSLNSCFLFCTLEMKKITLIVDF